MTAIWVKWIKSSYHRKHNRDKKEFHELDQTIPPGIKTTQKIEIPLVWHQCHGKAYGQSIAMHQFEANHMSVHIVSIIIIIQLERG